MKIKNLTKYQKRNVVIASAAALIIVVAGYAVLGTRAAGLFAASELEDSTLSGNAKLVNEASANGGRAVEFVAPTTTPPPTTPPTTGTSKCPLPKYPSDSCTGVPAGTALTTINGDYTAKAGEVVDGKRVTGSIYVSGNGVVIRNSEILGKVDNNSNAGGARPSFTIEDSTIGPAACGSISDGVVGVANYTAKRLRIKNQPDGFRIAGSNVLIEDSYVTVCSKNPDDHSDGIQVYGAANGVNITIRHNTIDQRSVTNGAATAPIFVPTDADRQGNNGVTVTVADNVVAGGGYPLRIYGTLPLTAYVTGNKVVNNSWTYGPVDVTCDKIKSWSGNAVVAYDWTAGTITSQVRALTDCGGQ
jgi:hypothetical protein